MTTPTTLFCFLLFMHSILTRRVLAAYRPRSEALTEPLPESERPAELPKSAKLAGMPLHLLLTEHANFGATLRETLRHRPGSE